MPKSVTFTSPSLLRRTFCGLTSRWTSPWSCATASPSEPARAHDELLQVLAVDVLEDDELPAVVGPAVDDGDDVRMREPCDRPRLAAEALDVFRVVRVVLVEDLDRDAPVELAVVCAEDARHAAGAHELLELVAVGDHLAGLRGPRHGRGCGPGSRHTARTQY